MIAGASAVAAASKSNVISVDFKDNPAAAQSVVVDVRASLAEQGLNVINALQKLSIGEEKPNVDAVICVAGGWTGGSIVSEDVFEATERMYQQSVYSSVIAGHIASKCLKR
ncbi:hypothetical protein EV182_003031 [Spiromyces aspiralis]|uniref:Uncharacterized protein n=1 Tax=Spiromyces aspiralis TaxID=68401 RepID=A0ACC1HX43_9FUNG|nr:hypothetical protein EV182_003031 [Spiromyces aspiralis]